MGSYSLWSRELLRHRRNGRVEYEGAGCSQYTNCSHCNMHPRWAVFLAQDRRKASGRPRLISSALMTSNRWSFHCMTHDRRPAGILARPKPVLHACPLGSLHKCKSDECQLCLVLLAAVQVRIAHTHMCGMAPDRSRSESERRQHGYADLLNLASRPFRFIGTAHCAPALIYALASHYHRPRLCPPCFFVHCLLLFDASF